MTADKKLKTNVPSTWCPGCGNFVILTATKKALTELEKEGLDLNSVVISSGIGCHAKIVDYIKINSFYSIHGRVPPAITGIKLANPGLTVIGYAGDGDAYGEGIEHLIFSAKRNLDATFVVHNNRVYGLTTGQFTPTSPSTYIGRSTPRGAPEEPLNPIELVLSAGATFVARAFTGSAKHLQGLLKAAIHHKGFAFIDVLLPCLTFYNTGDYYKEKIYELEQTAHDPANPDEALSKAREWAYGENEAERIPTGLFYQSEKPTYSQRLLAGRIPVQMEQKDIRPALTQLK